MEDSENLARLLNNVTPEILGTFLSDEFSLGLPVLDPKLPKRARRAILKAALAALDLTTRRQMDELAERFVLLAEIPTDLVHGQEHSDGLAPSV